MTGPNVASRFEGKTYLSLLERMTPANMVLMLFSSSLTTDVPCVYEGCPQDGWSVPRAPVVGRRLKEKWYGTQHQQLDLTKGDLLRRLTDAVNRTTATSVFRPPPLPTPTCPPTSTCSTRARSSPPSSR